MSKRIPNDFWRLYKLAQGGRQGIVVQVKLINSRWGYWRPLNYKVFGSDCGVGAVVNMFRGQTNGR